MLKITLVRSPIGSNQRQKDTLKALGLGKVNSTVEKEDNECIQGMIKKVSHLVKVSSK